jgi:hypothetical protein
MLAKPTDPPIGRFNCFGSPAILDAPVVPRP